MSGAHTQSVTNDRGLKDAGALSHSHRCPWCEEAARRSHHRLTDLVLLLGCCRGVVLILVVHNGTLPGPHHRRGRGRKGALSLEGMTPL